MFPKVFCQVKSNRPQLSVLRVAGYDLHPQFNSRNNVYTISLGQNETLDFDLSLCALDRKDKIVHEITRNLISVTVSNANGASTKYYIGVSRKHDKPKVPLKSLHVTQHTLFPSFNPHRKNYFVVLNPHIKMDDFVSMVNVKSPHGTSVEWSQKGHDLVLLNVKREGEGVETTYTVQVIENQVHGFEYLSQKKPTTNPNQTLEAPNTEKKRRDSGRRSSRSSRSRRGSTSSRSHSPLPLPVSATEEDERAAERSTRRRSKSARRDSRSEPSRRSREDSRRDSITLHSDSLTELEEASLRIEQGDTRTNLPRNPINDTEKPKNKYEFLCPQSDCNEISSNEFECWKHQIYFHGVALCGKCNSFCFTESDFKKHYGDMCRKTSRKSTHTTRNPTNSVTASTAPSNSFQKASSLSQAFQNTQKASKISQNAAGLFALAKKHKLKLVFLELNELIKSTQEINGSVQAALARDGIKILESSGYSGVEEFQKAASKASVADPIVREFTARMKIAMERARLMQTANQIALHKNQHQPQHQPQITSKISSNTMNSTTPSILAAPQSVISGTEIEKNLEEMQEKLKQLDVYSDISQHDLHVSLTSCFKSFESEFSQIPTEISQNSEISSFSNSSNRKRLSTISERSSNTRRSKSRNEFSGLSEFSDFSVPEISQVSEISQGVGNSVVSGASSNFSCDSYPSRVSEPSGMSDGLLGLTGPDPGFSTEMDLDEVEACKEQLRKRLEMFENLGSEIKNKTATTTTTTNHRGKTATPSLYNTLVESAQQYENAMKSMQSSQSSQLSDR